MGALKASALQIARMRTLTSHHAYARTDLLGVSLGVSPGRDVCSLKTHGQTGKGWSLPASGALGPGQTRGELIDSLMNVEYRYDFE